jgi:hypothetical protein
VIVNVAIRWPVAPGVKVTVREQFDPAATDPPQVFVSPKSPAFVPVMAILVTASGPVPPFISVIAGFVTIVPTGVLLKTMLLLEREAWGVPVPLPLRVTLWVAPVTPLALSVTIRLPLSVPVLCGSKVTLIVQKEDAASDVPQLLVCEKPAPEAEMLEIASAAVPPFVSFTGMAVLGVFTV